MRLSERQKQILSAIVEEYIQTGQPVGSKRLSQLLEVKVSPATVRSDMAYLYDLGFLEQPHTSAGRIPSHMGIRQYIDELMHYRPLTAVEKNSINSLFNVRNPDPDQLLSDAAEALSTYTGYTAITSSFMPKTVRIKRLEYIAASENAVVIILIATNGIIRSKVVRVDFRVTPELMTFFYKFANSRFVGKTIDSVTQAYISSVSMNLGGYSRVFNTLLLGIYELCKEVSDGRYYIAGATNVLSYWDEDSPHSTGVMRMLEDHDRLHQLLTTGFPGVQTVVGKENTFAELTSSTVVMTQYKVGNQPAGTVALVGPVQLDYARTIPHLEYFAKTLGELMTDTLKPDEDMQGER